MRLRHVLSAAVMGVGFASAAHATLSVTIVPIPLSAGASTDDPTLASQTAFPRSFDP